MRQLSVLVVEDEQIVANDVRLSLEKRLGPVKVSLCSSGEEAVQVTEKVHPDIVLMDIKLQGKMDGIEAAEIIKTRFNVPVLYLTSFADETTLQRAVPTEPFGYLIKPFDERMLNASIKMALFKHNMENKLKEEEEKFRSLALHIQAVREEERAKIARDIHDNLGQTLTALKMEISWIFRQLKDCCPQLMKKTNDSLALIDSLFQAIKQISSELRPSSLDHLGLIPAIQGQAKEFQGRFSIKCHVDVPEVQVKLDPSLSTTLFRIFQEAMTNIARHSKANTVWITLKISRKKVLSLKIRDNGIGITHAQKADPHSFGLISIKEDAETWDGEVRITGKPGLGTTMLLRIPLNERSENP